VNKKLADINSTMNSIERDLEKEWTPIRPQESRTSKTGPKPGSRATSARSISRTRSQNGYGCDDDSDCEPAAADEEQGEEEKDPFEVGWDDGENDPLNPRSKTKARKWVIVSICSFAAFCV